MRAQDRLAIAVAEAGRRSRGAMTATARHAQPLPIEEQLIQAVSRGAGVVALFGTVALLGWFAL